MPQTLRLSQLLSSTELNGYTEQFSACVRLACNILRHPPIEVLNKLAEHEDLMSGRDNHAGRAHVLRSQLPAAYELCIAPSPTQSPFCSRLRRESELGALRCLYCDIKQAVEAYQQQQALAYHCHAGLNDIVAPVRIGDFHEANMFAGQIRDEQPNHSYELTMIPEPTRLRLEALGVQQSDVVLAEYVALQAFDKGRIEDTRRFLSAFANLISYMATTRAARQLFNGPLRTGHHSNDPVAPVRNFLEDLRSLSRFDHVTLWMLNGARKQSLQIAYANWCGVADPQQIFTRVNGVDINAAQHVFKSDRPLVARTAQELHEKGASLSLLRTPHQLESAAVVPLRADGELVGLLELYSVHPRAFWQDTAEIISDYATRAAVTVSRDHQMLELVSQLVRPAASGDALHSIIVRSVPRMLDAVACSLHVLEHSDPERVRDSVTTGFLPQVESQEWRSLAEAMAEATESALRDPQSVLYDSIEAIPTPCRAPTRFLELEEVLDSDGKDVEHDKYKGFAFAVVPILEHQGRASGVIRVLSEVPITQTKLRLLETVADLVGTPGLEKGQFLRILTHTSTLRSEYNLQHLIYKFLTIVTHGEGLRLNRAILFEYSGRYDRLTCRLAVGPVSDVVVEVMRKKAREVDSIERCLSDVARHLERVRDGALDLALRKRFFYLTASERDRLLSNEETETRAIVSENDLGENIGKVLKEIGVRNGVLGVVRSVDSTYFLVCDNPMWHDTIGPETRSQLLFVCRQFLAGLETINRGAAVKAAKLSAFRDVARMAAHTLGRPLPPAARRLKKLIGESTSREVSGQLSDVLSFVLSAQSSVRSFKRFYTSEVPLQHISVPRLLEKLQSHLLYLVEHAVVVVKLDAAPDATVIVDCDQILSCFDMFSDNALRHATCVDARLRTEVGAYLVPGPSGEKERVVLYFADNGSGIAPEWKRKIFEPFFSTKKIGGGTGLAYVADIVETRHRGTVCECGTFGAGARFEIHLPSAVRIESGRSE